METVTWPSDVSNFSLCCLQQCDKQEIKCCDWTLGQFPGRYCRLHYYFYWTNLDVLDAFFIFFFFYKSHFFFLLHQVLCLNLWSFAFCQADLVSPSFCLECMYGHLYSHSMLSMHGCPYWVAKLPVRHFFALKCSYVSIKDDSCISHFFSSVLMFSHNSCLSCGIQPFISSAHLCTELLLVHANLSIIT